MGKQYEIDMAEGVRTSVGRCKIKYTRLAELIELSKVDIFHIDADSLIKSMRIDDKDIQPMTLASSLINLCGHYRRYFVKQGWDTSIYLYYSDTRDDNVINAIKYVSIILQYIDKMYCIQSEDLDTQVAIKYFINKHKKNLILSKSNKSLQLIDTDVHMLHPNKDKSVYYTPENMYNVMTNKPEKEFILSYKLINIVQAISGYNKKYPGISGHGVNKTIKYLESLIGYGLLNNSGYNDITDFLSDSNMFVADAERDNVINGFNRCDVNMSYIKNLTSPAKIKLDSYIIDKFSTKDLKNLNVKYFTGLDSLILEDLVLVPRRDKSTKW